MQMVPKSWLSSICLYVQAAHFTLLVAHCLSRCLFPLQNPNTCSAPVTFSPAEQRCREQLIQSILQALLETRIQQILVIWTEKMAPNGWQQSYWLYEILMCLFHTKVAIVIERGLIWTIISCCRSVNKSMPPIVWQREHAWEGNKDISAKQVNE